MARRDGTGDHAGHEGNMTSHIRLLQGRNGGAVTWCHPRQRPCSRL